jgi:glutathione S-transferase
VEKILYFSRNPNPRLAVAVARYLQAPVSLEFASTFAPENAAKFKALNPTQLLPILVEDGHSLWEADAIACRLSMMMGSNFWRMDHETPEMIRWISWAKANLVWAFDIVHWEYGTKQRYGFGPVDQDKVTEGEALFHKSAGILNDHLKDRVHLLDSGLSYADFRMATFLPYNDVAGLPVADYPNVERWYEGLLRLPFWAVPFAGLKAPELPVVPKRTK